MAKLVNSHSVRLDSNMSNPRTRMIPGKNAVARQWMAQSELAKIPTLSRNIFLIIIENFHGHA